MDRAALWAACRPTPTPEVMPTGCLSLDWALGAGGIPRGHLIEIFGPPDCGKTTLALEAIAAAHRGGGAAAFLDAEHALNPAWACTVGVHAAELLYSRPTGTSEAMDIVLTLVKSCAVDVIVLDSVAALGGDPSPLGFETPAACAVELSYWPFVHKLRELHRLLPKSPCCVLLLNQVRGRWGSTVGSHETTAGMPALPMMASLRIRMERRGTLVQGSQPVGSRASMKVLKCPWFSGVREASIDLLAERGVCREADLLTLGLRARVIERRGQDLRFDGRYLGSHPEEARLQLRNDADLYGRLETQLRALAGVPYRVSRAEAATV